MDSFQFFFIFTPTLVAEFVNIYNNRLQVGFDVISKYGRTGDCKLNVTCIQEHLNPYRIHATQLEFLWVLYSDYFCCLLLPATTWPSNKDALIHYTSKYHHRYSVPHSLHTPLICTEILANE